MPLPAAGSSSTGPEWLSGSPSGSWRPKAAKLVVNPRLHAYVQDRVVGVKAYRPACRRPQLSGWANHRFASAFSPRTAASRSSRNPKIFLPPVLSNPS